MVSSSAQAYGSWYLPYAATFYLPGSFAVWPHSERAFPFDISTITQVFSFCSPGRHVFLDNTKNFFERRYANAFCFSHSVYFQHLQSRDSRQSIHFLIVHLQNPLFQRDLTKMSNLNITPYALIWMPQKCRSGKFIIRFLWYLFLYFV